MSKSKKYWSGDVTRRSFALDLEPGVFTWKDPKKIARSLKRSAEKSTRRKAEPFQSAMSMLNFYINRSGKNLNPERRKILEQVKIELRKLFKQRDLDGAVIYELYVDKFARDFRGLLGKLDYFEKLGITALHILPHYPSPMIDDGYDVSDYRNVRKEFGSLADFEKFSRAARERGLRVIVDLVLNHVSTEHFWFQEAIKPKRNKYKDYFLWSKTAGEFVGAPNALPHLKPNNWIYNPAAGEHYFSTFYPEQADLNWDNPAIFEEISAIMDFWAERGVNGFRLDAASHLIKREGTTSKSLPETHAILKKIRKHVDEKYPGTILLAETHDPIAVTKKYFGDGDESHLVYNFPLSEAIFLSLITGDDKKLRKIIEESSRIPAGCRWATFLRNHDELALDTLTPEERQSIINYADPTRKFDFKHGRGVSMRLGSIFEKDPAKIIEAFKLLFSVSGTPVIYFGEEIGMKNLAISEAPLDSRRYVRGEFDWQEAEKQMTQPDSIFNKVAEMIKGSR